MSGPIRRAMADYVAMHGHRALLFECAFSTGALAYVACMALAIATMTEG